MAGAASAGPRPLHAALGLGDRSGERLQRGARTFTKRLEADIRAVIARRNRDPQPFERSETAGDILASAERFRRRVDRTSYGEL